MSPSHLPVLSIYVPLLLGPGRTPCLSMSAAQPLAGRAATEPTANPWDSSQGCPLLGAPSPSPINDMFSIRQPWHFFAWLRRPGTKALLASEPPLVMWPPQVTGNVSAGRDAGSVGVESDFGDVGEGDTAVGEHGVSEGWCGQPQEGAGTAGGVYRFNRWKGRRSGQR